MNTTYTKDFIVSMFAKNHINDIVKRYTKKQIITMYKIIYNQNPMASANKSQLVGEINAHIRTKQRAEAFSKLY